MWSSAGFALVLLVGLNATVPQSPRVGSQRPSAVAARREAHAELPGRGERAVVRATGRRTPAALVRRQAGTGQPAVTPSALFSALVTPNAAVIGGLVTGPQNAIPETPYAPRAPPGAEGSSRDAG